MEEIVWKLVRKGEMSCILSYDKENDRFVLFSATSDGQNALSGSLSVKDAHDLHGALDRALESRELGGER